MASGAGAQPEKTEPPLAVLISDESFAERPPKWGHRPPPEDATCNELNRDALLRFLGTPCVNLVSLLYIFLIVLDGAFFFFLMIGVHAITPQERANWWLNFAIQALCALFNYGALITLPWRTANAVHLCTCISHRSSADGRDLYGRPTSSIWFHIPRRHRVWIVILFLLNSYCQFINQAMRIVYPTYESSNAFPGVLLVNIFFVASFGFGIAGGIYQFWQEHRLRRDRPWDFAAGPIELLREGVSRLRRGESLYETFQGIKQLSEVESMSESPYSRATWETTARADCNGNTGHADVPPARAHAPAAIRPATPPSREPALRMLDILPAPRRELPQMERAMPRAKVDPVIGHMQNALSALEAVEAEASGRPVRLSCIAIDDTEDSAAGAPPVSRADSWVPPMRPMPAPPAARPPEAAATPQPPRRRLMRAASTVERGARATLVLAGQFGVIPPSHFHDHDLSSAARPRPRAMTLAPQNERVTLPATLPSATPEASAFATRGRTDSCSRGPWAQPRLQRSRSTFS